MINGGIKFFDKSYNLYSDGSSITATSGNTSAKLCIDKNFYTVWQSVGSNDATTETLEITFPSSKTINRVILQKHNFKSYTVKYWNGASYVDFTNVISILNSTPTTGISESLYSLDTSYYEFDSVSTTKIEITTTLAQTVNAQKYLTQFIATQELGTLEGFPVITTASHSQNERTQTTLSGKMNIEKSYRTFQLSLDFNAYPSQNDIDLITELFERVEGFNVWICGGKFGSTYYRFTQLGYNLRDIYFMQTMGDLSTLYHANIFTNAPNTRISFVESI